MTQFQIIPAIDIKDGQCVRLYQGNFGKINIYNLDPFKQAKMFETSGYKYLHVVDLDGAVAGKPVNLEVIETICRNTKLKVEVSGGIRNVQTAKKYKTAGAWNIILGSIVLENFKLTEEIVRNLGSKNVSIALDFKANRLAKSGWLNDEEINIEKLISKLKRIGINRYIVTDILKDGTLSGSNYSLAKNIKNISNCEIIVSGGIKSIKEIKLIKKQGLTGVIIGKALYENKISFNDLSNVN